ncbi:unnamed protein product [Strongylus vulgaris]|uniref:U2A'/phosphoprotein 32 family A C-terminal domain-containing protein n=1 Tax=Strongylus vulgaris TaxID=40348 RepID=A0A3P7ITI3_STRVU|nr:unnamed protein product [Strongylus vulgaris]
MPVRDVSVLLHNLHKCCPNLTSLSLIGNPGWRNLICDRSHHLYKQYRKAALEMLPHLRSIDAKTTYRVLLFVRIFHVLLQWRLLRTQVTSEFE